MKSKTNEQKLYFLRLYDQFRAGKKVAIDACCQEFNISIPTFRRYIAFLRGYFNEFHGQEITYLPQTGEYALKGE